MSYLHRMKTTSPSGDRRGHHSEPKIHQSGMHRKSPSAVEPHPKGGHVDNDGANQRGNKVGQHAPTIGPRSA